MEWVWKVYQIEGIKARSQNWWYVPKIGAKSKCPENYVFYIELYIANKVSLLEKKIKAFSSINQTNVFNKQLSEPMVILKCKRVSPFDSRENVRYTV